VGVVCVGVGWDGVGGVWGWGVCGGGVWEQCVGVCGRVVGCVGVWWGVWA
jgi:hypothetical protein